MVGDRLQAKAIMTLMMAEMLVQTIEGVVQAAHLANDMEGGLLTSSMCLRALLLSGCKLCIVLRACYSHSTSIGSEPCHISQTQRTFLP